MLHIHVCMHTYVVSTVQFKNCTYVVWICIYKQFKLPEQKAATFAATLSFPLDAESPDYYYELPNEKTIGQYL